MKTKSRKTALTRLSMLICVALLMGLLPGNVLTAKAADSAYYLSIPSNSYTVAVSDGIVTLADKSDSSRHVSFQIGWTDYSNHTPYTDLNATEESGSYKIPLPQLVKGEYSYPDYYVETTAISEHAAFLLSNDQDGFGFTMHVTDEQFTEARERGEPLRYEIYASNLSAEYPALSLSLIPTGNPADYPCSLSFTNYSSRGFDGENTNFSWSPYGEEYEVTVVSDSEDVSKTVTYNEFYENRGFINTADMSSYAIALRTGNAPEDVRLVIDDKEYEFDANGRVSLKDFTDHKLHTVTMKAVYPDISACQVEMIEDQYYTGKALKPQLSIVDGEKALKEGTDYIVSYSNNKNIGYADVNITGKGEYKGTYRGGFAILPPKKGKTFVVSGYRYKITDASKYYVSVTGATKKTATFATVPASVKIGGLQYQITGIDDNAFSGYKKLKQVTVGKNVTVIGKKAFYGDGALKKLTFKSEKIKTVGAGAFKGIPAGAKIKVPSAKVKAYTKLFRKNGLNKKVKVTK